MGRPAQIILSVLAIAAIAMNVYALFANNRGYFLVARVLLMPAVVVLTMVVFIRARSRDQARRFPGDGDRKDKPAGRKG